MCMIKRIFASNISVKRIASVELVHLENIRTQCIKLCSTMAVVLLIRTINTTLNACKVTGLFYEQPPTMSRSPKSKWHDGQRQINEAGKCVSGITALRTKFRGGAHVQACHAAVLIEFAFRRLGVVTTQAS